MTPLRHHVLAAHDYVTHRTAIPAENPSVNYVISFRASEDRRFRIQNDIVITALSGGLPRTGYRTTQKGFAHAAGIEAHGDVAMARDQALAVFQLFLQFHWRHRDMRIRADAPGTTRIQIGTQRKQAVA